MYEVWTRGGYGITCIGRYAEKNNAEVVLDYHRKMLPTKQFVLLRDDCEFEGAGECRSWVEADKILA